MNEAGEYKVKLFESMDDLRNAVCEDLIKSIEEKAGGDFYLALSGGNTPAAIYKKMVEKPFVSRIPFERVHFFWGDERCVPADDPNSNYGMAHKAMLASISIPEGNIHRIRGENDPKIEAARYEEEIKNVVPVTDGFPRFDWIFLGLGEDGHTASLFPGSESLEEKERSFVSVTGPKPPTRRISITLPAINNSVRAAFLVTGAGKSAVLSEIIRKKGKYPRYPASRVELSSGITSWYIDGFAGKLL